MPCIGATGSACTNANGEDARAELTSTLTDPPIFLLETNSDSYTLTWPAQAAGHFARVMYKELGDPLMSIALVDAQANTTWVSPTIDLTQINIVVVRMEEVEASNWLGVDIPLEHYITFKGESVTFGLDLVTSK